MKGCTCHNAPASRRSARCPARAPAYRSAAENLVPGLGGFLLRLPPPLVAPVPVDGRGQSRTEVAVDRLPAEFGADLAGVVGIAQVVAGPVGDVVVGSWVLPSQLEDELHDLLIAALVPGTDQVGLAGLAQGQDAMHGGVVVVHVRPLPPVLASP